MRILITGVNGQDGSYLAELLLSKKYDVYGLLRRNSTPNMERIAHLLPDLKIIQGDMQDMSSLLRALEISQPHEVYNLAAMSYVGYSGISPVQTMDINALGLIRLLDAIRTHNPTIRVYQASSSEMLGMGTLERCYPRSPYGVSKLAAHWIVQHYREAYGMFVVSGILYNHESPRRGLEFVTRKITNAAARIRCGLADHISLGNISSVRDWGYAPDYVRAMWLMLQRDTPKDYVIATGETHTVEQFARLAFEYAGLSLDDYLCIHPDLLRSTDVPFLLGDAEEACKELKWSPSISFEQLVRCMVNADIERYSS